MVPHPAFRVCFLLEYVFCSSGGAGTKVGLGARAPRLPPSFTGRLRLGREPRRATPSSAPLSLSHTPKTQRLVRLMNSSAKCPGAFCSAAQNILQMAVLNHFNYTWLRFSAVYVEKSSLQQSHSVPASYFGKFQPFLI